MKFFRGGEGGDLGGDGRDRLIRSGNSIYYVH
jgi:hypothetical protein